MTHPVQLGCVWCTGWSLWMVIASLANTDFAFFGLLAALVLAAGGIIIGINEIDQIHECPGNAAKSRIMQNGYRAMARQEQAMRASAIEFRGDFG